MDDIAAATKLLEDGAQTTNKTSSLGKLSKKMDDLLITFKEKLGFGKSPEVEAVTPDGIKVKVDYIDGLKKPEVHKIDGMELRGPVILFINQVQNMIQLQDGEV